MVRLQRLHLRLGSDRQRQTYSVLGTKSSPGIIPRTVDGIFAEKARLETSGTELQVWVSYLEIYKEHIHDLLRAGEEKPDLHVLQHPKLGMHIPGLLVEPCFKPSDVERLMDFGTKRRAVGATHVNATSSRSRAVFCITLQRLEGPIPKPHEEDGRLALNAKINLVDLEMVIKELSEAISHPNKFRHTI